MQRIVVNLPPDPIQPFLLQKLSCTGFSVDLDNNTLTAVMLMETFHRTESEVETTDPQSGETTMVTVYGEWEPYRRVTAQHFYPFVTSTSNAKFVDPQTFKLVPAGTPGAIGEVDAIWSQLGPPIEGLLGMFMERMIERGNFNDLSKVE